MQYTPEQAYELVTQILDRLKAETPTKLTFEDGSTFTGWAETGIAEETNFVTQFIFADGDTYPKKGEERNRKRFHITEVVKVETA